MKRNILSTIGLTAVFAVSIFTISSITDSGTTSAYAFTSGSPGGRTNSPSDGSNCTACHSGTIMAGNGTSTITSNIPAGGYVPGQTYTISTGIASAGINKFGFEVTAEKTVGNAKVGTFALTDAVRTKFVNSNTAVSHTSTGTTPLATNATTWSFDWTAPIAGSGDVTFYGAFNAVNGNSATSGDVVYASTLAVTEDLATGISNNLSESTFNIYPNPVKTSFQVSSDVVIENITVFDLQGKQVANLAEKSNKVNMESLPTGMYVVNVQIDGKVISKKIIKE
jgi:hypothetical protein